MVTVTGPRTQVTANEHVRRPASGARDHEVRELDHPVAEQEPGQQHVGVEQVELLPGGVDLGLDGEVPAPLGVEERGEDGGGVEVGPGQEVHGAVHPDERDSVEIADDPVLFDGEERHG